MSTAPTETLIIAIRSTPSSVPRTGRGVAREGRTESEAEARDETRGRAVTAPNARERVRRAAASDRAKQ